MRGQVLRSPFFYVGDKYKLIEEIGSFFPSRIDKFVEPFVGGGSVFMNVTAKKFCLNDIDAYIIKLHELLCESANNKREFFSRIENIISKYGLSYSYKEDIIPQELKKKYKKTYFAKFNKEGYVRMRDDFNDASEKDMHILYLLLIYGFNRMLRFNKNGIFNLPVGNVDFNANVVNALNSYFEQALLKTPQWFNSDYKDFLTGISLTEYDFVYLDPPYLITYSEYNKLWKERDEEELLQLLDLLDVKNIKFAISNVTHYKGRCNNIFMDWAGKYNTHPIKSNYISYYDNTIKEFNEVLITNY